MEQLISMLSLDATNIIHSVIGMLELIGEDPLTEDQSKYLRACRGSVDRLHRAVRDAAELSGAKSIELNDQAFDINEVITGIASVMGALVEARNLRFNSLQEPDAPALVRGDRARIEDMMVRLLDHAIRSSSQGEVGLRTSLSATCDGKVSVEIVVSDSGPGILSGTFDENQSFLDTTNLGLLIVQQLVERMDGAMSIKAEAGVGSRVCVRFAMPVAAEPEPSLGPAPHGAGETHRDTERVRPLNLLVAEDSDDSYMLLEAFLKRQGHRLTRAIDGAQAVELFRHNSYDFVLMDIRMPVMDGFSATRVMRELETAVGRCRIPIVVLSAEDTAVQIRMGATVGCTGYLMKPVSKATLLGALRRFAPALAE